MERKIHIVIYRYYDFYNEKMTLGGVQTYVTNLIEVIRNNGMSCEIYQPGDSDESRFINGVKVSNVKIPKKKLIEKQINQVVNRVFENFDDAKDVLLFATDCITVKNKATNSVAIQHGIFWDIPQHKEYSVKKNNLYLFKKSINAYKIIRNLSYVKNVVCVDYNFVNWYRALVASAKVKLNVIPNFTEIAPENAHQEALDDRIKIIFARRFFEYRGTRIFANAVKRILKEYDNIDVTVAGEGPDEEWLKSVLGSFDNVSFIKYDSSDSLEIHKDKHIAVVPTVGSEGTSLSLLEAMSAQCAVICTNVGGMTNIVIDRYNGLMINPDDENALYNSIKLLIDDKSLRDRISQNGYKTVSNGFSLEIWQNRWEELFKNI